MAVTRIKYKEIGDKVYRSRNLYSSKYDTYYYVVKDQSGEVFTFRVVNVRQQRTIYSHEDSRIRNQAVLHRTIREKLASLGVDLKAEIRPHQNAPSIEDRRRGGNRLKLARKGKQPKIQEGDVTDE